MIPTTSYMKPILRAVYLSLLCILCLSHGTSKGQEVVNEWYTLSKPQGKVSAVLILFGGYPQNATDIQREFNIKDTANQKGVAVVYMNYSRKLWLTDAEKSDLADLLQELISTNNLPKDHITIGGFSSGGNVAMLISNYLIDNNSGIKLNGVFVVDSPIDLVELYNIARKNIERNLVESSMQESQWLIQYLESQFNKPDQNIPAYEEHSVATLSKNNFDNIKELKSTKIRFYTEPDTAWWKNYNGSEYEQMNAYHIKRLVEVLKKNDFKNVEYIATQNRGYRSNGIRHPHSWSIVDPDELMDWILSK